MRENVCTIEIEKQAVVVDLHKLLEVAGQPIIAGCEYDFEFSNPNSWVDLANEVAMVAVGAYLGAVQVVNVPVLQEFVASIATTEARHDTYLRAQYGAIPAPSIYDTALPPTWTWDILQNWIQSCPEPLSYPTFPPLSVDAPWWRRNQSPSIGKNLTVNLSWRPSEFLTQIGPKQPLYLVLVANFPPNKPILVPVSRKNIKGTVHTGTAVITNGLVAGVVFAALTTFVELDSVQDLVQYGTLAGPVEILMS